MNEIAEPTAARLHRSLESVLSRREQLQISIQLGSGMLAGGLLLIGVLVRFYGASEQQILGVLFEALAALVVGVPVFVQAARGVFSRKPKAQSQQLIALASLAAMAMGDFVTATLILLIMHIGHFLEERSVMGAQAAVEGLRKLQGQTASICNADGERHIDAAELRSGDVMIVRPGDVIAADGRVTSGLSTVDQSSITGESTPEDVAVESQVFAGSVNLTGTLHVEVTNVGSETAIGRVVELLHEAEKSKTPVLRLIEHYAGYTVLIVLVIAAVVLFATRDLTRAITVLIVGCPIPFVLAGPTAMVAALAAASRLGILIKNGKFLESLADVDTLILDKTGTVTVGELQVVDIQPMNGTSDDEILRSALVCARGSRHPVCRAIVESAKRHRIESNGDVGQIEEFSGNGVQYINGTTKSLLGRGTWLRDNGMDLPAEPQHNGALVWLARSDVKPNAPGAILGYFLLADEPRPEAMQSVNDMRGLGIDRQILLTGDRAQAAESIGKSLQLDQVIAEVLPEQKLATVDEEKAAGNKVMVVGDGINDALALAAGDVGIAMGGIGSDIALKSADVVLAQNDLSRLPVAIRLSRQTRRTIHENVVVGAAITLGMLLLAASGVISPLAGAVLQNVGEIYVIGNSARLLNFK